MKIAVTGYYGTGSSAVIDFLSEFKSVKCAIGNRYEHYPFLGQNAIFDLENRLFDENSNYMIRDYAINEFIKEMKRQNDHNFGWFGSYKKLFKNQFMNSVNEFVDAISTIKNCKSFTQVKKIKHTPLKAILQIGARIILKRKIYDLGRVYVYDKNPIRFLTVDHNEFMIHAKKFINSYFEMCQVENFNMVYDHLILPEQARIINKFFDDDFKLIVVDRDPRDVYLLSEHYWSTLKFGAQPGIYPEGEKGFCSHWDKTHEYIKTIDKSKLKNVMFVQFEDLVYNYDETTKKIIDFCGLKREDHINAKKFFDPSKSINNTQIFNLKEEYAKEVEQIKNQLNYLVYDFPYEKMENTGEVFDN